MAQLPPRDLIPCGTTGAGPADVVAGLLNNGMAFSVATAAVHEAVRRAGRVRFVQVLPPGLDADERAEAELATFGVALHALHGHQRVPCTFEAVQGDAGQVLVERSHDAAVLVVGRDDSDAAELVGQYCQRHSGCDVLVVADECPPALHVGVARR